MMVQTFRLDISTPYLEISGHTDEVRVITRTRSGEESSVKSQDDGFSHES